MGTIFQILLWLLCLIFILAYFSRKFHFGLEWFKYIGRYDDKAFEAFSNSLDKYNWILLLGVAACALLYKWLYM
jgi:hypothetical protein